MGRPRPFHATATTQGYLDGDFGHTMRAKTKKFIKTADSIE
jgi:hypothetical protein